MNNNSIRIFGILLVLSLIVHLVLLYWWSLEDRFAPERTPEMSSLHISLVPAPVDPLPVAEADEKAAESRPVTEKAPAVTKLPEDRLVNQEEIHAPMHNSEQFSTPVTGSPELAPVPGSKAFQAKSEHQPPTSEQATVADKSSGKNKEASSQASQNAADRKSKKADVVSKKKNEAVVVKEPGAQPRAAVAEVLATTSDETSPSPETSTEAEDNPLTGDSSAVSLSLGSENEEASQAPAPQIPTEFMASMKKMKLLEDESLANVNAKDPLSEAQSRRIQMVNRYLLAMEKQIRQYWHKPKELPPLAGVARFELDNQGYLTNVYIIQSSGNLLLDNSVIDAIKSVHRYSVPRETWIVERYYRNLRFSYSSVDARPETIPLNR